MEQLLETATSDLRLALFALGAIFLLALVVWEFVQRKRLRAKEEADQPDPLLQSSPRAERIRYADVSPLASSKAGAAVAADSQERLDLPSISVRDRLVEPEIVDLDSVELGDSSESLPVFESGPLAASDSIPLDAPPQPTTLDTNSLDTTALDTTALEPASGGPLRLEWPDEARRSIISLRIVSRADERFTGVSLRQALQGEGFVHGELDIFHRPLADSRVLLSAASLTRPGSFDLSTMDSTRYLGLNVFAVLPGPLPGRETVDKLLLVGHTLAQRLRGELRDSRGEALSESRLAEMRREAAAADDKDSIGTV